MVRGIRRAHVADVPFSSLPVLVSRPTVDFGLLASSLWGSAIAARRYRENGSA